MKESYKYILTFVILACFATGLIIFNAVGTYSNDDWWAGFFWTKNIIKNILDTDQGLLWSWHFEKFLMHVLPSVLHWHPQQNIFVAIVKGIDFALYAFLLSLFFKPMVKKIPNPLVVLINTLLVFYIIFLVDIVIIIHINQHLKYFLNLIIGGFIWYIWINEFLNNKFLLKENRIRDCIFAFILAFSGHLVNIPTIVFLTGLVLYEIFKTKDYSANLKKLLPVLIPLVLIYAICLLLYLNIPGFTYQRNIRAPQDPILIYSFTHFWDFTQKFFECIFSKKYIWSFLILNVIGFIGLFFNRNKIDKKYLVITISIFLANFVFQYSLLTCGTTFYDHKSYWFKSSELQVTFLCYLVINCNIIYGCLYRCINKTKFKIAYILSIFILINLIYPINIAIKNIKSAYNAEIIQRIAIYKVNKLYRYYSLKQGNTIYLPAEYYNHINNYIGPIILVNFTNNMELIYHVKNKKKVEITDKKVINEYELFTEEEIENIDFKKLYDDNFILRMKEPILVD